jgi:glycosyltransferase involved in cell wall biosynthesis
MIYFLIPMYNEEENLNALHAKLISTLADKEKFYVFVDDCSKDKSVELVKSLFPASQLNVITKEVNGGPGHSFNIGMEWVLQHSKNENDILVTMEADGTSDINILPHMVGIAGMGYEMVLASVYAQGGGFRQTQFLRKILSFCANMMFRAIFDVKVLTLSSFYRVYKISMLKRLKTKYDVLIAEPGFICMFELLIKTISVGAGIIEVPMVLRSSERVGKSKMKVLKTTLSYVRFLVTFRKK